ncbi:cell division suppressor protein YneA [Sporosarcina sp. G11-34]|uniref:cell division suppressor protein YneA n=1 Tax=Sporosarcina sp. G11-34 TaxID=2849605 RepID=UPI0022A9145C|nr:LysM peptidoglycan-binding domain-containing protein [Sporosarcina sp. G11-34]MCZ2258739.1 LysM peptidoglycan-binding domain-containing protein [Sporosarcina sp. G11-34]
MTFIKNNSYLLLILVLCITFSFIGTKKIGADFAVEEVTISEGDTLWGLSVQYGDNISSEKWIEQVMKLNNLTSVNIQIGHDLKIPRVNAMDRNDIATNLAGDKD